MVGCGGEGTGKGYDDWSGGLRPTWSGALMIAVVEDIEY